MGNGHQNPFITYPRIWPDNDRSISMNNLFSNIPTDLSEEVVETLLKTKSLRIERIVSHGHASAEDSWYDQHQHEWVLLLRGEAKLQFEDDTELLSMKPGDYTNIPAHRRHRVEWTTPTEPTIWLVILYASETG